MVQLDDLMKRPVDMEHYFKHKERLDRDIQAAMEAGTAEKFGVPPGFPAESVIKRAVIMCDKYPALGKPPIETPGGTDKPMTGSQKRKAKRQQAFDRNAEPDEVIEYEMVEAPDKIENDRQFKVVSAEDWKPWPNPQYKKNGQDMPKDFEPFKKLPDGPVSTPKAIESEA